MTGHDDNDSHECETTLDMQTVTLECKSLTHSLCSIWSLFLLPYTLPHLNILMIFLFSLPRFYLCVALLLSGSAADSGIGLSWEWEEAWVWLKPTACSDISKHRKHQSGLTESPLTETLNINLRPNNWDGFLNYLGHQEGMSVWKVLTGSEGKCVKTVQENFPQTEE